MAGSQGVEQNTMSRSQEKADSISKEEMSLYQDCIKIKWVS